MAKTRKSFRVERVRAYLRNRVWYLCYHENGVRRRPRVGSKAAAARQLAAQTNAQLEVGAPALLSFEAVCIADLRERWLQHHELALRSSVHTITRYRTASDHLLRFLKLTNERLNTQHFRVTHAESFVRYLRNIEVAPNGHVNSDKRPLMDKGIKYVLESCRSMFNFGIRRRHFPPYAENPFRALEVDRIPVELSRPIVLFTSEQERRFLELCDPWQFPLFLTLMLTGLRSGELTHLLLPGDLDFRTGILRVRNKPRLRWQIKTRNERDIPLVPILVEVLQVHLNDRAVGPVFLRRRFRDSFTQGWKTSQTAMEVELARRIENLQSTSGPVSAIQQTRAGRRLWNEMGAVREVRVRVKFSRLTARIGLATYTAPKMLRHLFATALQAGRVDPLIRNELMGHVASGDRSPGGGLAMTAVYTHTQPATRREQLEIAMASRLAIGAAKAWLNCHR